MIYLKQSAAFKKTFLIIPIFLILGIGLSYFYANQNFFYNFKPYYLKAYAAYFEYASDNIMSVFRRGEFYAGGAGLNEKAQSVPVLVYHGILPKIDESNSEASEGTNVSIDQFKDHMFTLKRAGWNAVSIEDFYLFMQGKKDLPKKSFLLTFDDGRKESYYPADPILSALNFRAVMFAITKFSLLPKSYYYLTTPELKQMISSGRWEIEAHAEGAHEFIPINENGDRSFFLPNRMWLFDQGRLETMDEYKSRIKGDLAAVKEGLKNTLGVDAIAFAFPSGEFGENSENIPGGPEDVILNFSKENFKMTFHQFGLGERFRANYPDPGKDFFTIKRMGVRFEWSGEELVKLLEQGNAKKLPFKDQDFADSGWVSTGWGIIDFMNNTLYMHPKNDGTGVAAVLDGTRHWKNYIFSARVNWPKGKNVYLWARYQDDDNYVACNFSNKLIHIEQTVDGELGVIKGESGNYTFPEGDFTLGILVDGRRAECMIDGKTVLATDFLDSSLSTGGIGVKAWDPILDNSEIIIKEVNVDALAD
ncbi:polysaccharide deacetylase family protein [Candidatus Giovannonibacteria bacterium]|nr:polysaccharide deacetylase family protein [Candidatus Giovannonibacteria bacterium]